MKGLQSIFWEKIRLCTHLDMHTQILLDSKSRWLIVPFISQTKAIFTKQWHKDSFWGTQSNSPSLSKVIAGWWSIQTDSITGGQWLPARYHNWFRSNSCSTANTIPLYAQIKWPKLSVSSEWMRTWRLPYSGQSWICGCHSLRYMA